MAVVGRVAPSGGEDVGDLISDVAGFIARVAEAVAVVLLIALSLIALILLGVAMLRRIRHASLVVRPFADPAVEAKVGAGIAALVEERLIGAVRRQAQSSRSYALDQVITDIEVLAEDNDLAKAMTRLGDVPQFQLVVAVLDLLERLLPSRGLAAGGELLPAGDRGAGISLALYRGNELTARSSMWQEQVNVWFPGEEKENGAGVPGDPVEVGPFGGILLAPPEPGVGIAPQEEPQADPSPYYGLAAPAAWWIQYEASRALDKNVSQVTASASSFALVGIGLTRERHGFVNSASDAYARALDHDSENLAALVNLAQLLSRERRLFAPAALLLVRASDALSDEPRNDRAPRAVPPSFRLGDPNWFRIRYALAQQCLQLGSDDGAKGGLEERGWPAGISSSDDLSWGKGFGPETQALLANLFDDRALTQWGLDEPRVMAYEESLRLILASVWALDDAGWHWVGRRPPPHLLWLRRRSLKWVRNRPPAGDRRLARFLSEVVEPAAVVMLFSTWVSRGEDSAYRGVQALILDTRPQSIKPLDRRTFKKANERKWATDYLAKLLSDGEAEPPRHVRLAAKLGFTRFRPPKPPNARVRYNLACLFSRLAEEADRRGESRARKRFVVIATNKLEKALSGAGASHRDQLAAWAQTDPGLRGLRDFNKRAFASVVAHWGPHERRRIRRIQLDSSAVLSAAFDEGALILELEFSNRSRYQYFDVKKRTYMNLIASKSPGRFFADQISGHHAFLRL